jgi:hypothetical protein
MSPLLLMKAAGVKILDTKSTILSELITKEKRL